MCNEVVPYNLKDNYEKKKFTAVEDKDKSPWSTPSHKSGLHCAAVSHTMRNELCHRVSHFMMTE
jgi:hypothetical protein